MQTAHGSIEAVISAMRAGATDFVVKPVGAERLQVSIKNALRVDALEDELRRATRRNAGELGFRDIVSRAESMARVIRLAERAAKSNIPVLIEGESGVGKELMARAIQGVPSGAASPSSPSIAARCRTRSSSRSCSATRRARSPARPKNTSANSSRRMAARCSSTRSANCSLDAQVKLLRALQEGEIDPVGARRSVKVDFRLVSATNQNLIELVKAGRFREDLFYRLNVFPISIPPLARAACDVPDLARRFLARFCAEEGKRIRGISAEALALLSAYDWPGNVRQLENALFRAVVLADGDELTTAEFPQIAAQVQGYDVLIPSAPPPLAADPLQAPAFLADGHRDPRPACAEADQRQWRRAQARGDRSRDPFVSPSPITADKCPRSPASSASGARRFTAK